MLKTLQQEFGRKLFHLIGLIYVFGFLWLPRSLFVIVLTLFLIFETFFELLRLKNRAFKRFVTSQMGTLIREKEKNRFTGTFWMLVGVLTTALLIEPAALAATVVFYLILGDGIASLAGKSIKGPKWGRSDKRMSGSVACFVVCFLSGMMLMRPDYSWIGIIIGATVATALEAVSFKVDDNLIIPVGASLSMMVVYGLKPIFI